jgi:hypothetical protein
VRFLTHILCDSYWIMGDRQMSYIYWLLVNFQDNLVTSCTSIEKVNLPYSHIGILYYSNTRKVRLLTHILCDSYWIMADRQMSYIYWLLVNFQDNLVTSFTSIEQVNLPYSHNGKTDYINTGIVILPTHILCDSYWIMGDGQMSYIYWLLVNFQDNLVPSCTSIEQVNLPYSHIANLYYINTGIVILLTHILCDSYWIMSHGRMLYIFWLLGTFKIIWSQVALLLRRSTYLTVTMEKYIISTLG